MAPASDTRPSTSFSDHARNSLSVISLQPAALEVCHQIYGESTHSSSQETLERFYESNAIYENPVITATSRSIIADIFHLSHQLSTLSIPRPFATLCTILRLQAPEPDCLWRALRAWSEINDVCENESFDGHRKCIIEHTFHLVLLPGIHKGELHSRRPSDFISSNHSPLSVHGAPPGVAPCVSIPGTSLQIPSPFHFKMHIITRLAFNEQGRITHHRDFWDIKDVMGLVPGVSLAQWLGSRVMARGLSFAYHSLSNLLSPANDSSIPEQDLESAAHTLTPAASYSATMKNALGLEGI